ncbi:hypothetical protein YB2330_005152 [Saitoella coloradoensis]
MVTESLPPWAEKANAKRAARDALLPSQYLIPPSLLPTIPPPTPGQPGLSLLDFPHTSGLFTEEELEITETNAADLVAGMKDGKWKAVEVMKAFCHRATVAQGLVNPITEVFFDKALERAEELDKYYHETGGKTVGPLHGLPISLKDQFKVEGVETTMGYVSWIGDVAKEDSVLVKSLKTAGAIPFVKTNIPQTLMMGDTYNNIFQLTLNPANTSLSPGGSSGGEGALVSFRGSPMGVGTDIGGSVRLPSSFCGLWGLRPSHGRISYWGAANSMVGQEAVTSCAGPMSHSPADLSLFMRGYLSSEPWQWDPEVIPMPWDMGKERAVQEGKCVFGMITWDGVAHPHPPIARALEMTRKALLAAGHEVIDVEAYDHARAIRIIGKLYSADGGKEMAQHIEASGEPWLDEVKGLLFPTDKNGKAQSTEMSVLETWEVQQERNVYAAEYLNWWAETAKLTSTGKPIDGYIMPVAPHASKPNRGNYRWMGYSFVTPLLDLSTGAFPVTTADPEIDTKPETFEAANEVDQALYDDYDAEFYKGGPAGLQVVCKRLEDEKCVGLLRVIEKALTGAA